MKKQQPVTPTPENKTFINEVDDALREERLAAFWAKYKLFIIGGIVALFAFVAGKDLYASHQHKTAQAFANSYADAERAKDLTALTAIANSGSPFAPLAANNAAQLQLNVGNTAAAVALWDDVTANKNVPLFAQDLARFNAAGALLGSDTAAAEARLLPLLVEGNAFRLSALELQARILMSRNEKASAAAFYEEIAGTATAPRSLKQRAQQALATLR